MGLHYSRLNRAPCFNWSQDDLGVCACAIGTMACVNVVIPHAWIFLHQTFLFLFLRLIVLLQGLGFRYRLVPIKLCAVDGHLAVARVLSVRN